MIEPRNCHDKIFFQVVQIAFITSYDIRCDVIAQLHKVIEKHPQWDYVWLSRGPGKWRSSADQFTRHRFTKKTSSSRLPGQKKTDIQRLEALQGTM
jgi:hypothetical protein